MISVNELWFTKTGKNITFACLPLHLLNAIRNIVFQINHNHK